MFENSTVAPQPSAAIASVLLGILILFSILTFLFGNTQGRELFYSLVYLGLFLSIIGFVFSFRFFSATRRAGAKKGKAILILLLNLLIFLAYIALTILVTYDNMSRGRNILGQ